MRRSQRPGRRHLWSGAQGDRRLRKQRWLVAGAVLCIALVSSASGALSAVVGAPKPVRRWTASVCAGFARWEDQLAQLASTGAIGDVLHGSGRSDSPDAIRIGVTRLLDGAVTANDRLVHDIESAGVPKIKNGPAIAAVFLKTVQDLGVLFTAFRVRAQQLPPDQPGPQFRETQDLASLLQTVGTTLQDTTGRAAAAYPTSGIRKAFTSTKVCKPLL